MDEEYWERARAALTDPDRHKRHEGAQLDAISFDDTHKPRGAYTAPQPPPADMPVDPVKWAALSRKRRRQLIRYHRKQVRGR